MNALISRFGEVAERAIKGLVGLARRAPDRGEATQEVPLHSMRAASGECPPLRLYYAFTESTLTLVGAAPTAEDDDGDDVTELLDDTGDDIPPTAADPFDDDIPF